MSYYIEYTVIKELIKNVSFTDSDILYDLGSGDGRIIIEFAKSGLTSKGIELDLEIYKISSYRIADSGLTNCSVVNGDFNKVDWSDGTIIILNQGITELQLVKSKLKVGMKVISIGTKIPDFDSNLVNTISVSSIEEAFVLYLYGNYAELKDQKLSYLVSDKNHKWMKNPLIRKPVYNLYFYEVK